MQVRVFFCKKQDFLNIHFEEELWLDAQKYPIGEDQVMFYKMHKKGLCVLTSYSSGIVHLDAGTTLATEEKAKALIFADFRYKTIFWHRFIWLCEKNIFLKLWSLLCIGYAFSFALVISLMKGEWNIFLIKRMAIKDGIRFLQSDAYKQLPRI